MDLVREGCRVGRAERSRFPVEGIQMGERVKKWPAGPGEIVQCFALGIILENQVQFPARCTGIHAGSILKDIKILKSCNGVACLGRSTLV